MKFTLFTVAALLANSAFAQTPSAPTADAPVSAPVSAPVAAGGAGGDTGGTTNATSPVAAPTAAGGDAGGDTTNATSPVAAPTAAGGNATAPSSATTPTAPTATSPVAAPSGSDVTSPVAAPVAAPSSGGNSTGSTGGGGSVSGGSDSGNSTLDVDGTVLAVLANESDLSLLWAAAQKIDPSQLGKIVDSEAITLFAPVNDAAKTINPKYLTPNYTAHLTYLIRNHGVEGEVLSSGITDGMTITPLIAAESYKASIASNGTIFLSNDGGFKDVAIIQADLMGGNGVVHKINGLLIPVQLTLNLLEIAQSQPQFSQVKQLLQVSGMEDELTKDDRTVFSPSDVAFQNLPSSVLAGAQDNPDLIKQILSNHLVAGVYPTMMLTDGLVIHTINDFPITIAVKGVGRFAERSVNGCALSVPDAVASNGLAQVIDCVLMANATAPTGGSGPAAPTAPTPTGGSSPHAAPTVASGAGVLLQVSSLLIASLAFLAL